MIRRNCKHDWSHTIVILCILICTMKTQKLANFQVSNHRCPVKWRLQVRAWSIWIWKNHHWFQRFLFQIRRRTRVDLLTKSWLISDLVLSPGSVRLNSPRYRFTICKQSCGITKENVLQYFDAPRVYSARGSLYNLSSKVFDWSKLSLFTQKGTGTIRHH